jgi:glycosyltransferase involved in cell wall biosynthesis
VILIDGRMIFQDQADGVARVVVEMLRHRPASTPPIGLLVPRGADQRKFGLDELLGDVRVHPVDAPIRHIWKVRELSHVIREHGYRVFLAPYAPLLPLRLPCASVAHVHDCILESDVRLSKDRTRQMLYVANMMRVLRQARVAVVPSDTTAATLGAFYSVVPETVVCKNGVNAEHFAAPAAGPSASDTLARLGVTKPFVLSIGARRPHKNQKVLVEAIDRVPADVSLVLVGNPDPRVTDDVAVALAARGTDARVIILPRIDEGDLVTLLRESAAFAFPSVAEGFGLPPLEAMAAGAPVIASAIPIVAEVTLDASILVSPYAPEEWARAIGRVIAEPEQRERMVTRGREVVGQYSWETGSAQLFSLLERVADRA